LSSDWQIIQTGSGQSIFVTNSELRISTGAAIGETIIRHKKPFNIPCKVTFIVQISQRIANQSFYLEMIDDAGTNYGRFYFNGTNSSNISVEQINGGSPSYNFANLTATITTLTSGLCYEIEATLEEIKFSTRQIDALAGRSATWTQQRRIPDPSANYYIQIRAVNTAVVTNTTFSIDSVSVIENEYISAELSSRGGKNLSDAIIVTPGNTTFPVTFSNTTIAIVNTQTYANDTTATLTANSAFVGTSKNVNGRGVLIVVVDTDQAGNLYLDQSFDNSTFLDFGARACTVGINTFTINPALQYVKIRYVNGATNQTRFRVYSQLKSF
jgi:hypothetical protein